jgi:hypothetical protein
MYESEITRFLRELKQQNPNLAELQRKNRSTWWDHPQDLQEQRERAEAAVPQPPYVYFPLPTPEKGDDPDSAKRLSTPSRPA